MTIRGVLFDFYMKDVSTSRLKSSIDKNALTYNITFYNDNNVVCCVGNMHVRTPQTIAAMLDIAFIGCARSVTIDFARPGNAFSIPLNCRVIDMWTLNGTDYEEVIAPSALVHHIAHEQLSVVHATFDNYTAAINELLRIGATIIPLTTIDAKKLQQHVLHLGTRPHTHPRLVVTIPAILDSQPDMIADMMNTCVALRAGAVYTLQGVVYSTYTPLVVIITMTRRSRDIARCYGPSFVLG